MRIINQKLQIPDFPFSVRLYDAKTVYIDIETTGLNRHRSHLYLLGAMWAGEGQVQLRQWFAERPSDEEEILRDFFSFIREFDHLIQFNGSSFDLPYLRHKAAFYEIEAVFPPAVTDLYHLYRPLKNLLLQEDMKLTHLEVSAGYDRTDHHSGKELIKVYDSYLQTADPALLAGLLQHNTDDIVGMLWLEAFDGLLKLQKGSLSPADCPVSADPQTGYLNFSCRYDTLSLPPVTVQETDGIRVTCRKNLVTLTVPVYEGTLYHFFTDYKNYYYFPSEDRAMHKSVAVYADPASRIKATKDTCYEPHTGRFLRTFAPLDLLMFQTKEREASLWFVSYKEALLKDPAFCSLYAVHMISHLLSR